MLMTKLREGCDRIRSRWRESAGRTCRGVVLMFHEIHADDETYLRELKCGCTASFLQAIIGELRREQWDIVGPDEASARLRDGDPTRRFAVLTFDDGYRDVRTQALAVLEDQQAPFTVYVPAGAPTRGLDAWWLGVRALLRRYDQVAISGTEMRYACGDHAEKVKCRAALSAWVHEDYRRAVQLQETFRAYDISLEALNGDYFLAEPELRELACNPLVTVGSHTVSHAALGTLDDAGARREMAGGRAYLESLLDRPIPHFAYPYGGSQACGGREFELARDLGFRSAVTTRERPVFAADRMRPHEIPRIGVSGTMAHFAYLAQHLRELRNASAADF
ncbi:MAG TPA: polysaccharide deacetylase family protein [Xanthobacteraceae bacterium]